MLPRTWKYRLLCFVTGLVLCFIILGSMAVSSDMAFSSSRLAALMASQMNEDSYLITRTRNTSKVSSPRRPGPETVWMLTNSSGNTPDKISCKALVEGSTQERKRATDFMHAHSRVTITPDDYIRWTRDCEDFRTKRKYVMEALPEEMDFPLAFSILMYTDVEQTERLLRAVYRPHNCVCIHVDGKANAKVKDAMAAIASCLPGVFVHPKPVKVSWGKFTVLEADLICMKALLSLRKWRYFINLTGQEFPLKTNLELVRILKAYNGGNDVDGFVGAKEMEKR